VTMQRRAAPSERVALTGSEPQFDNYHATLGAELYDKAAIVILATTCTLTEVRKWFMHESRCGCGHDDCDRFCVELVCATCTSRGQPGPAIQPRQDYPLHRSIYSDNADE
jgi:hypothetical protein